LVFWFHSFDITEGRASVHVGVGTQDDHSDAKVWLEPEVEIAREGRTLRPHELRQTINVIEQNREFLLEEWYGHRRRAGG
jgi:hypothetical protein